MKKLDKATLVCTTLRTVVMSHENGTDLYRGSSMFSGCSDYMKTPWSDIVVTAISSISEIEKFGNQVVLTYHSDHHDHCDRSVQIILIAKFWFSHNKMETVQDTN